MTLEQTRAQAHQVTVEILRQLAISEAQEFARFVQDHPEDLDRMVGRLDELKGDIRRYQVEVSPF